MDRQKIVIQLLLEYTTCSADMVLASFSENAIAALQIGSDQFLASLRGSSPNQIDYDYILNAILNYEIKLHFTWSPEIGFPNCAQSS